MTATSPLDRDRPSLLRSYCQLLRLPNIFTAMADVAMGFLVVQAIWLNAPKVPPHLTAWMLGLLAAASGLLYAAGMVLNDVFDLPSDRIERPERPLPSGRISLHTARWLGWELLLAGTTLTWVLARATQSFWPGVVGTFLAGTVVLYDAGIKRTLLGPLAMGACRGLNVLLGMSVLPGIVGVLHPPEVSRELEPEHWLIAAAIGLYVTGVTWLARNESARSDRRQLAAASLVMLAGIGLLAWLPRWLSRPQVDPVGWCLCIGLVLFWLGERCARAVIEPTPQRVQMAVGRAIMMLVILDTAACCAVRGPSYAFWILVLIVPATFLGRWIRST